MRNNFPFPVTPENFSVCWDYVDVRRRKARTLAAIAKTTCFPANLFFLLCILFAANGLIYQHFHGPYHAFLAQSDLFTRIWDSVAGLLLTTADSLPLEAVKLLGASYVLSTVVFLMIALAVALAYHPRKQAEPDGSYTEKTAALVSAAREARACSYRTRLNTSVMSVVLVVALAFVLLLGFTAWHGDAQAISELLSRFPTTDPGTNCLLYVLAAYLICDFLCRILLLLTRFIYRYEFSYHTLVLAETGSIFASDAHDVTPEDAENWTREALELERNHAYGEAKALLLKAALLGNTSAMEHYARHCLLVHMNDSARYWLQRCVATGQATKEAKSMLRRIRLRLRHNVGYLQPEEAPLSKAQQSRRKILLLFTLLWRIFILAVLVLTVVICIVLVKSDMDLNVLRDLSTVMDALFA